jgi:hypothetical protein
MDFVSKFVDLQILAHKSDEVENNVCIQTKGFQSLLRFDGSVLKARVRAPQGLF